MDETGGHQVKHNNPDSERQILVCFPSQLESRPKKSHMIIKGGLLGGDKWEVGG
jgi:hypothetical protein